MRVLSKGSRVPFVEKSVDWGENINFKDYDTVFVNLRNLEERSHEFSHPLNDSVSSPKLFDEDDVETFINTGGELVVYLPENPIVKMGEQIYSDDPKREVLKSGLFLPNDIIEKSGDIFSYNLLDWLPFEIYFDGSESGESVENVSDEWKWYFLYRFKWQKTISLQGNFYNAYPIAMNSYDKILSLEVQINKSGKPVYLIPPKSSTSYSDFVKNTLANKFGFELDIEERAQPDWVSDFKLPNEETITTQIESKKDEIEDFERELSDLQEYKSLLYEGGNILEETTVEALRELGFTIDGEIPGKRDGVLHTDEMKYALEVTGTSRGIKKSKGRQLDDWVENLIAESPDENVSGLLIVNPQMGLSPNERDISVEPNVKSYLQKRGDYKVLTTLDLFSLIEVKLKDGIEKSEIESL